MSDNDHAIIARAARRAGEEAVPNTLAFIRRHGGKVDFCEMWLSGLTEYSVPPRFYDDCLECDCDVGFFVRRRGSSYVVACTQEEANELLSRARYYDAPGGALEPYLFGLQASARATILALARQGVK